jgi:hypothetical protein
MEPVVFARMRAKDGPSTSAFEKVLFDMNGEDENSVEQAGSLIQFLQDLAIEEVLSGPRPQPPPTEPLHVWERGRGRGKGRG